MENTLHRLVDDARFDFTMDDFEAALHKLNQAITISTNNFDVWHTLAEVQYSRKDFKAALEAAEKAHAINPDDLHINTTLSRIWLECGNKERAEHFGAQARMQSWKEELRTTDSEE